MPQGLPLGGLIMGALGCCKCRNCHRYFKPDPRNRRHQKYCSAPACRAASKSASQAKWLSKPQNQDYFHGAEHVARVHQWREAHPGYGKKKSGAKPLQEVLIAHPVEIVEEKPVLTAPALQDVLIDQPAVLIGLIAHLTASPLQDDIAQASRHLLQMGRDILARQNVACTP